MIRNFLCNFRLTSFYLLSDSDLVFNFNSPKPSIQSKHVGDSSKSWASSVYVRDCDTPAADEGTAPVERPLLRY